MELREFNRIKNAIAIKASADQILELEEIVRETVSIKAVEVLLVKREAANDDQRICPRCSGSNVVLHGRERNGRRRFRCRAEGCGRTFNTLTGTPLARAKKPSLWSRYCGMMGDHLSVRAIKRTGIPINHVTVWRWRHRFLKAAINDNTPVLSGVIEADETFFVRSFKGDRGWKKGKPPEFRAARPSGWGAVHPGLGIGQVAVLTALDNTGGIYEASLPGLRNIAAELRGRIAEDSILCSDGAHGYKRAAKEAGVEHRTIKPVTTVPIAFKAYPRPTKPRRKGAIGLGRVNAHHGQLKVFINGRCRGVATKYLPAYLAWHRVMVWEKAGKALLEKSLAA